MTGNVHVHAQHIFTPFRFSSFHFRLFYKFEASESKMEKGKTSFAVFR